MRRAVFLAALMLVLATFGLAYAQSPFEIRLFIDNENLTVYIPATGLVSLRGFGFQVQVNGEARLYLLEAYVAFGIPFDQLPTPVCFRLRNSGTRIPRAQACNGITTLTQELAPADVFWFDTTVAISRTLLIVQNDVPFSICPSGVSECLMEFAPPTYTPASTDTLMPSVPPVSTESPVPTLTPIYTETATDLEATVQLHLNSGYEHLSSREYESALFEYNQALDLDPDNPSGYNGRGVAYTGLSEYERAIEDFDHALALNPESASAFQNRGIAYQRLNDLERAIADYDRAIEIAPENVILYGLRGHAYLMLGEYERAMIDYDQAIALEPENVILYYNRGYAYVAWGEYERAIADYDQAIAIDPDNAFAYNERGYAYAELRSYERALVDYDQAITLNPNYAEAYQGRGVAYYYLEVYQTALEDMLRAEALNPDSAVVRWWLMEIYILLGECTEAEQALARYLELAGEAPNPAAEQKFHEQCG